MSTPVGSGSIVVGIDGTSTAVAAARWAGAVANRLHVPMVLLGVVPSVDHPLSVAAGATTNLMPELRAAVRDRLERARQAVLSDHPQVDIHIVTEDGAPAHELIEHSASARMVVVAANVGDRLSTLLLGSTALTVANKAPCPVVVWRGREDQPLPDERPVLVGVDGSPGSSAAVAQAFELAAALDVEVIALHVWNDPDLLQWIPAPGDWATLATQEKELLSERMAGWSEKYPDVRVTKAIQKGTPTQVLLERANDAQLVLTGSRGHNRLTGLFVGSTSQNLLHHAPHPVIICREQ
ncbi:universal stress protein [Nocardia sp. CNY236]|uniref:universal stress protein n=1 Tax=Nocardia sp. CNY236 TaxID=1169152 RepID=UPI0004914CDE|nr:universal stress protein [Nocardia sp. CNY236]